jgi:predicted AlkP superfamily pyrophosphatase or phosphodiesterase
MATQFQSKVISISIKDRGAILPGGHNANAAYWYDGKTGGFVSSTYYMDALPPWVDEFNNQPPARAYCGKPWKALPETPGAEGQVFKEYRAAAGESCPSPRFIDWVGDTPYMNEIALRFARAALREEKLGQGAGTDLLAVSLSANDHVGHEYGPYSPQVADMTLRTDRDLAAFLDDLDKSVGLQHVWVALSGDHGAAPTPQYIKEHNLGHGLFESKTVRAAVEAHLSSMFGEDKWIENLDIPYIYLNLETLAKRQVSVEKAADEAAHAAMSVPGVFAAFSRASLISGNPSGQSIAHKAFNSLNLDRGGEVFFVLQPYSVASGSETSTSHGTPWGYDAQVPLIFWGSAFRHGEFAQPCQPVDLAVTLAAALGIEPPSGAVGSPLLSALAPKR